MHVTEVADKKDQQDFLSVNVIMNRHNPKYIQPLNNEVNDVFDPAKNKAFKYGTVRRWLLKER